MISLLFYFALSLTPIEKAQITCAILKESYPKTNISCNKDHLMVNQTKVTYFLGNTNPDIATSMKYPDLYSYFLYSYGAVKRNDAGRIRIYEIFDATYGKNKQEIKANLETINFFGKKLKFNKHNNAGLSLSKVYQELKLVVAKDKTLLPYLLGADTFNYRTIKGTKLLSAHSYGIAIDLNPSKGQYWEWDKDKISDFQAVEVNYPLIIAAVFEKHGFIWGGRWEHYDSMHFEYRPEFLLLTKKKSFY